KFEEDLVTYFQNFQNTSESSDGSTNVVNAPREPFVFKQDHGVNPSQIDECCCECGNALDGIFCQQCTCKYCGKGAHIGYNCSPKVPIISNPEPCNQTMNNELPQTLPSFDTMCYSDKENSVPCVSKPSFVDESYNIFNPHPQPPIYYCEFCGSNAQYGHYCTPQAPFINPKPGYSQDFNFSQNIYDFQQQYLCCDRCGGPHETFQCQQVIIYEPCCENYGGPHENFQCQPLNYCEPNPNYDSYYSGFDQFGIFTHNNIFVVKIAGDLMKPSNKQEEKWIEEKQAASAQYWKIPACCDDDDDYNSAITPVLSTKETENSLSIGDEHLDTISETKSDEVIKSSVEDLIPIPSESEGIPDTILEVAEIVISEVEEIEDDNLRKKLLNVHLLIANIEALKDNPTPSSKLLTKSSSTSPKSFLEETNTFHNSLSEFENFCFDLEEISSGSTTTNSDISLPDYEFFYFHDDHIEEISSGSTTAHYDISLSKYDSFIFDLSNDQCPPSDRSDFTHEEFADELVHIKAPPSMIVSTFGIFPIRVS
nr:hypothetical protein [Tanacetum cinerariifolium]